MKFLFKSNKPTKVVADVAELQIRQLERLANAWSTAYNSCSSASKSWLNNACLLKAQADKLKTRNGD